VKDNEAILADVLTLPQEETGKRCWWGIAEALG
jgi:hypothetical protein